MPLTPAEVEGKDISNGTACKASGGDSNNLRVWEPHTGACYRSGTKFEYGRLTPGSWTIQVT